MQSVFLTGADVDALTIYQFLFPPFVKGVARTGVRGDFYVLQL